jgi:DNA polymerase III epsilon subunit-like protein
MGFLDRINVMIDLETLSTRPDAAIVSIGAVKFSFDEKKIVDSFLINVDATDCKRHGMAIEKSTIDWWKAQPKEVREAWMKDPVPLEEAIDKFNAWYGNKSLPTWSHGASFDIPILEYIHRKVLNKFTIWNYWDVYCCRTIINLSEYDIKTLRDQNGSHHNALEDAKVQATAIMEILGN